VQTALANESRAQPRGRRTKALDPVVCERLVYASSVGCGTAEAAHFAGIGRSTYLGWLARGRKAQEACDAGVHILATEIPFLDLLDRITRAHSEAVVHALGCINTAASKGHWRAAAWFLERAYPDVWGPPSQRRDSMVKPSAPLYVSADDLEDKVNAILNRRNSG
jgi:hypothetical protein